MKHDTRKRVHMKNKQLKHILILGLNSMNTITVCSFYRVPPSHRNVKLFCISKIQS
jgi:hypothetical protein